MYILEKEIGYYIYRGERKRENIRIIIFQFIYFIYYIDVIFSLICITRAKPVQCIGPFYCADIKNYIYEI